MGFELHVDVGHGPPIQLGSNICVGVPARGKSVRGAPHHEFGMAGIKSMYLTNCSVGGFAGLFGKSEAPVVRVCSTIGRDIKRQADSNEC